MAHIKEIIGETAFNALPDDKKRALNNIDYVDSSNYVVRSDLDNANETIKDCKKQLKDRDTQLNDLQGKVKDNEELTKEINNLKTINSTATQDYENKIKKMQFDTVLNNALKGANAKDSKIIRALLDESKLTLDGENVIGLKEQLEVIKKEKDFLFEKEIPGTGSFNTGGKDDTPPILNNFATELGKQKAETLKIKGITDFAK